MFFSMYFEPNKVYASILPVNNTFIKYIYLQY